MRFKVEAAMLANALSAGRALVVARQLDAGDFTIGSNTALGGVLVDSVTMPRKVDQHGKLDTHVFAFSLRDSRQLEKFEVGQIVRLEARGTETQ